MKRRTHNNRLLDTPHITNIYRRLLFVKEENWPQEQKKIEQENIDREKALYEYYGENRPDSLDESTRNLITKMAKDLKFRGFMDINDVPNVGRKPKWRWSRGTEFVLNVEKKRLEHPDYSVKRAVTAVKHDMKLTETIANLLARYNEMTAKKGTEEYKLHESIKNAATDAEKRQILDNFFLF